MEIYRQVKQESSYIPKYKVWIPYSYTYWEIYTEEVVEARKLEYIPELHYHLSS